MKCTIPEISWHNRDPVLSIDIQPQSSETTDPVRLATGGTDSHVLIWHLKIETTGVGRIEFAADLQRHQRAVNVVRWSPSGEFLASGDDEAVILIWKQKTDQDAPELPSSDDEQNAKENWISTKVLRGHVEDIYDLSWSPDSNNLVSGSVDNTAILWDVPKGRNMGILSDHKGFVQGVSWDPQNQFIATLSSDRVFNLQTKRVVSRIYKSWLPIPGESETPEEKVFRLYHDDTLKSFFRRLTFTPDGELLITPAGLIELEGDNNKHINTTYIYSRHLLNRPVVFLPTGDKYTIAVRCCPVLFELRPVANGQENNSPKEEGEDLKPWEKHSSLFALPYRIVFAVATQNSVLLYDTQQPFPFARISRIHYTRLSDLSWSSDGRILVVSSTDGYCSIISFFPGELGIELKRTSEQEEKKKEDQSVTTNKDSKNSCNEAKKVEESNKDRKTDESTNSKKSVVVCDNEDNNDVVIIEETKTKANDSNTLAKERSSSANKVPCAPLEKKEKSNEAVSETEAAISKESKDAVKTKEQQTSSTSVTHMHSTGNKTCDDKKDTVESMEVDEDFKLVFEDSQHSSDDQPSTVAAGTTTCAKATLSSPQIQCTQSPQGILHDKPMVPQSPIENLCQTPGKDTKRTPGRRVPFITLSSPKSKKKLL